MAKRKRSELMDVASWKCANCGETTEEQDAIRACPGCKKAACPKCGENLSIAIDGMQISTLLVHPACKATVTQRLRPILKASRLLAILNRKRNKDNPVDPDEVQTGPDKPKGKKGEKDA